MLNFKELSSNGDNFELLIREILYNKGLEVYWSGKGPDGGKDLLCVERHKSYFKSSSKRWLIQCKHNAHSGKSVGIGDLDDIVDSCTEHDATGYLLVCSTYPSSGVVKRLEGIQSRGRITTEFWDYCVLERELLKPENWSLITMFMPKSADKLGWRISSIDTYLWYASYNRNIFYIALRIGTNCEYYLKHISDRIEEINNTKLPKGHIIRLRAVYFDDKYTNYLLYLDYLIPQGTSERKVEVNDDVFEICSDRIIDGVSYTVDLVMYEYAPWSDNFDIDHQGYYSQFISSFKCGGSRNGQQKYFLAKKDNVRKFTSELIDEDFTKLINTLNKVNFIQLLKCANSKIEYIDQFSENFSWIDTIQNIDYNTENFFDARIRFECDNFKKLSEMLGRLPISVNKNFSLEKDFIFLPDEGFEESNIYTLKIKVHPALIRSKLDFRKYLNQYLSEINNYIDSYINEN